MGGSSNTSFNATRSGATPSGNAPGGKLRCPAKLRAVVTGPAPGIQSGAWLNVQLEPATNPPRVVFVDIASGAIVGSLTAIPDLDVLIECLRLETYRAHVDAVTGGRVDVTVIKQ